MSLNQILTEDIRLALLRFLSEGNAYSLNESILHAALGSLGHHISRDRVRCELAWLSEQGLLTVREVVSTQVATLTGRGLDIAAGLATVPGVKRPSPRG
jgi:Fe2+ or Zn2+ uptake regulation protein